MSPRLVQRIKHHPEVIPLLGVVTFGLSFMTYMGLRAAIKTPDVVWDHKRNPFPWMSIKPNEHVKMLSTGYDYSKVTSDRPEI